MTQQKLQEIEQPSDEVLAMQEDWDLVDALWGGTKTMREAAQKYLPKRRMEDSDDYAARLALSTLYPAFSESISALVGRAFAKEMLVGDKLKAWFTDELILDDVDMQGRKFHVYCKDWLQMAMRYGLAGTLIEAPAKQAANLQEQKDEKLRPYLIPVNPRRVLGWREEGGKFTQLRIRFNAKVNEGKYATKVVEQIRVYEPTAITVHEKNAKGEWTETGTVTNSFGVVPFACAYTGRTGFMTAAPPLLELANLNMKHWRLQSSNDSLLEVTSVPILALIGGQNAGAGDDAGGEIVIGAKSAIELPVGGDMKYVEHTGASSKVARESLEDLKEEMRQAGAKMLTPQSAASKTETQSREENARENSRLGAIVKDFADTATGVLDLMAKTRGEEDAGDRVTLTPDLTPDFAPIDSMKIVMEMKNAQMLSPESTFNEAKRRGIIDETLDFEEEERKAREAFDATNPPPKPGAPNPLEADPTEVEDDPANPVKPPSAGAE